MATTLKQVLGDPRWKRNGFRDWDLWGTYLKADPPELFATCEKGRGGRWSVGLYAVWSANSLTVLTSTPAHFKTLKLAKKWAEQAILEEDERHCMREGRERTKEGQQR
jgi:hypothetical protein